MPLSIVEKKSAPAPCRPLAASTGGWSEADARRHVRRLVRSSGTSSTYGDSYCFCREVDDIADDPAGGAANEADRRRRLGLWRDEIEALYESALEDDIGDEVASESYSGT